ncbi:hypothetical protein [Anaplasma bovis]|uniref:hypothetical protein n=1 Tax=Anaplasma bovis TaxID=186733 RepID=UPI002FF3E560
MDKPHKNDSTIASRYARVEDRAHSNEQHLPKVYGLRNRWGNSIELTARQIVERKLRNRGKDFRPLLPDIEEESLRSAWKHAHMCREQELDRASTVENRCQDNVARKLMAGDAVVQVFKKSETVYLTSYRISLSGEFPGGNDVGSTQYSVEFSKPLKVREFHVKNESSAPGADDRCNTRARKLMARDAVVPVSDSDTVVPIRYVSLSDEAYVGGGMMFPPPLIFGNVSSNNGVSSMDKLQEDRYDAHARKLLGQDAIVPVPGSQTVYPTGYTSAPESKVHSGGLESTGIGEGQVLGKAVSYHKPESRTQRTKTAISKSSAPVEKEYNGFDKEDTAVQHPRPEAVSLAGRVSRSEVSPSVQENIPAAKEEQVLGKAVPYHKPESRTQRTKTAISKSSAPVEKEYNGFDKEDTAVQQPHPEAASFAGRYLDQEHLPTAQESVSDERKRQVLDAKRETYSDPPSHVPHIKTAVSKGGVSDAGLLAKVKKAATKGYARRLLKRTLIAGSYSEDVSLTGYVSLSEEVSHNSYENEREGEAVAPRTVMPSGAPDKQRSHVTRARSTTEPTMSKNDVNSMLSNEIDDQVTAPFEGRALTQEEIPQIRRAGMKLIDRALSMQTPSSAIRRLEFEDVQTGDAAMKDLHRSFLHIYGVHDDALCISSMNFLTGVGGVTKKSATLNKSFLDQYPSDELCSLLKMTKEEYKSNHDRFGYRAISATVLKELIYSAAAEKGKSVTNIHPALIEELVTTVSQAGVCGFPSFEVQLSGYNLFSKHPPEKRHITMKPVSMGVDRGVYIDFKSENELSVYSHFYPTPWLGGYVATHIWYDVSVSPDNEQLHYKNFVVRIAFPGVDKVHPEKKLRSKIDAELDSVKDVTIFNSPPRVMPVVGFMLEWNLPDESIPIADMFSVRITKKATIRDSVELIKKRLLPSTERDEASGSEASVKEQEEGTRKFSIVDFIKSVFMRLYGEIRYRIAQIKKSISYLLSVVGQYFYKPKAVHNADEKQSCSIEREAVADSCISISDKEQATDLIAELPSKTAEPLSTDDDILEKVSTEKTSGRKKLGARNAASAHLGDRDVATETQCTQMRKRRGKGGSLPRRYPSSYLSDSSVDDVSRRLTIHVAARTR